MFLEKDTDSSNLLVYWFFGDYLFQIASSSLVIPTNYENPENLENQGFPDFLRHSLFIIIVKSVTLILDNKGED